ncbi:phage terminase large subunit family protein [Microvirga brassicacearum]|uniref:Phage terminase large subunit family protein n=1 Tax=Microvirga brassicacearum TaxID=2580413 RepID=A0A5N3PH42_9HYPH|nr:terminase gpA endonuclease subunit [Microvirga brassicacearum]KAB0269054.1 phage terminase large subunit family protein [Microvirga brassicacearum]
MSRNALGQALRDVGRAFRPPPVLSYSDWSEKYIRLPSSSAISGRYKLWKYQRRILEAIGDPLIERVTVRKPTRIGYTRLLCAALGADMANDPCSVILLLPTDDDARGIMVDEVDPTFQESPAISTLMRTGRYDGKNTLTTRSLLGGGSLKALSARAPRNLRRHTARKLYCDEVDGMEVTKEGDPIALAEKRTESFADRKIVKGSTPTDVTTSIISRDYDESDRQIFKVPCPHCNETFELLWEHISFPHDSPAEAVAICPLCGCVIEERFKPAMVEAGDFEAQAPDVKGHAGFQLNALVSLQPNASWGQLAAEYLKAKRGGPSLMQGFWNTVLGLPWNTTVDNTDEHELLGRVESFGLSWDQVSAEWRQDIPRDVLFITCGVDVQPDRLEMVFIGWSRQQRFILGHHVIVGATNVSTTWDELDSVLLTRWDHPLGNKIGIEAAAIDSGDGNRTSYVYDFAGPRSHRRIYAIKGKEGPLPAFKFTTSRRVRRAGARLAIVGVEGIKTDIMTSLSIPQDGLQAIRFSDDLDEEWFVQFTSERRKVEYRKGRKVETFVRIGYRAAEALDATVYGLAVRATCVFHFDQREADLTKTEEAKPPRMQAFRDKVKRLHSR